MPLITSLISYWKLNESSGDAVDSHGTNTLTETSGTIAAATGKITGARDFELGDTEYFTRADNAALSTGDIDFTVAAWVWMESKPATDMTIMAKHNATIAGSEYQLIWNAAGDRFLLETLRAPATATAVTANNFGAPSTGTWYHVVGWHDSVNNITGISVNAGTANTTAFSGGCNDSTTAFTIGAGSTGVSYWDGLICEAGFWKKVLTSTERTSLYRGGTGLAYPFVVGRGMLVSKKLGRTQLVG